MARSSRMELLDRVLDGKDPEVKARVLDLMMRMGIDPEDEFFLIFIALGQLQVLIEDSPNEWREVFTSFRGELRSWEESNLKTLEHLTQQVQVMERLTKGVNRLIVVLKPLAQGSTQLKENWDHLSNDLENLKETTDILLDARHRTVTEIALARESLEAFKMFVPQHKATMEGMIDEMGFFRNILRNIKLPKSQNMTSNFWMSFGGTLAALVCFQLIIMPFLNPL